jgi:hypothetical protein
MKDSIIQLKKTKIIKNKNETIKANLIDKKLTFEKAPIKIDQVKNIYDYCFDAISILGILLTVIYTFIAIRKLFKRDEQKQEQINELIKHTQQLAKHNNLYEKRIRMLNKPRIWSNGGSVDPFNNEWDISIDNKGEEAKIIDIIIVGGDIKHAEFYPHALPWDLEKGNNIRFKGKSIKKNPHDLFLKIKLSYFDVEGYEYESFFDWKAGATILTETKEL